MAGTASGHTAGTASGHTAATTRRSVGRRLRSAAVALVAAAALLTGTAIDLPAAQARTSTAVKTPGRIPESDYHRTAADRGKPITPNEAFIRGEDWIEAGHTYDQENTSITDRHGTAYRADCSGFVSMAWHAPQAYSTETIEEVAHRISWDELGPGDALNRRKSAARDGHIVLVVERLPFGVIRIMHFGSTPPTYDVYHESTARNDGFYPVRYDKMQVVTDEMVREAIRERAPKPRPSIQPGGRTLVNFDSIFYVDGAPYNEVVPMAGGSVQVELYAEQTQWLWKFGDDKEFTSAHPGNPYPGNPRITHQYKTVGQFDPSVDITWSNYRFRIVSPAPTPWRDVDGSHVGVGPTTPLTALELKTVLGSGD